MMVLGRYALNGQVQESLERLVIAKYYSPNDVTFGCIVDLFLHNTLYNVSLLLNNLYSFENIMKILG